MDVSLRGAVSIARRLQDPLAELVKIDPKAIGVGQYQHDVNQTALARTLDGVVEDAVNGVGVDLNTASAPLLERVRSEEHTSELQSRGHLVCRLLLEKKKDRKSTRMNSWTARTSWSV